ncbi:hypothetical protein ARSEF4850_010057 [Beauveria asiatica]
MNVSANGIKLIGPAIQTTSLLHQEPLITILKTLGLAHYSEILTVNI